MSGNENSQPERGTKEFSQSTNAAIRALESSVRVLETHRETMAASSENMRLDVRELRDRMARLETKVDGLPTKDWIGGQVYKAVGLTAIVVGMIATILHLLGKV